MQLGKYTVMRFLDLKETSTDMAVDWIFEKFKLISGTFGTAWDKYSKNGLTFGSRGEFEDSLNFVKKFVKSQEEVNHD